LLETLSYFFRAEDGIRDRNVTGVQTCALPILFINGTRNTKNANGRNCPGFKWKIFAAKTVGMLQGTSVMPTVPAASVQRDKFLVASHISLYFCTNVRAGKIFDKYCSPLARATINVDKIVAVINEPVVLILSIARRVI